MSLYYNLLDEQILLLKEKGYEEKNTGSPDKEGWLFTRLGRELSGAVRESWQEHEPVKFQLRTTGFFNNDKDIVNFQFSYLFDIEKAELRLTELELKSEGVTKVVSIESSNDLPHSSTALKLIEEQSQTNLKQRNNYKPIYTTKHLGNLDKPNDLGMRKRR